MLLAKPSKQFFAAELLKKLETSAGKPVRILEMGCGTAEVIEFALQKFPNITYVGIEPYPPSFQRAKDRLKAYPNATVLEGFGYGEVKHPALEQPFDIVFSLSVLEHVKQLKKFMDMSIAKARPGGEVIHLYDLGHSLHPGGLKEWVQTRLCSSIFLPLIPEHKVARYVSSKSVEKMMQDGGCTVDRTTFHNMPNLVQLLKGRMEEKLMQDIVEFETAHFEAVADISQRERLFPSICVWAKRI